MKNSLSVCVLFLSVTLFSCKKSNDSAPPKDYSASIKDKNWCGTLAYTGKTAKYYSVAFKGDNSLIWSQRTGDTGLQPGIPLYRDKF